MKDKNGMPLLYYIKINGTKHYTRNRNQALAAKSLGVSPQCVQGHVSLIISKGWAI